MQSKFNYFSNTFCTILSIMQTDRAFQIISFIATLLSVIVTISFTIYKWYKSAMKDGKITDEELDDLKDKLNIKGKKK